MDGKADGTKNVLEQVSVITRDQLKQVLVGILENEVEGALSRGTPFSVINQVSEMLSRQGRGVTS